MREQVINTANIALDIHRAVYEAATPVSLPSSVVASLPPVPEPLPAPSALPSGHKEMHVTFAPSVGESALDATPKKAVVSTPFHKRAISQLPPIVASQSTPKKHVRIVDANNELDIESQLPAVRPSSVILS